MYDLLAAPLGRFIISLYWLREFHLVTVSVSENAVYLAGGATQRHPLNMHFKQKRC